MNKKLTFDLIRPMARWMNLVALVAFFTTSFPGSMLLAGGIVPDGRTKTHVTGTGSRTSVHTETIAGATGLNSFSQFDVSAGQTVDLHLPAGTINLLNLVDGKRSDIHGIINALQGGSIGGNLYLANPDGIVIGPSGVMNAGSLHLSTPTRDAVKAVLEATGELDPVTGMPLYQVNEGLLGAFISNTVPISPTGLISVQGQLNAQSEVTIRAGTLEVLPTGEINAGPAGRQKQLQYGSVVNTQGSQSAGGAVKGPGGKISLVGIGDVRVKGGRLNAAGDAETAGGKVEVKSDSGNVEVTEGALINTSAEGPFGGGEIAVDATMGNVVLNDAMLLSLGAGVGSSGGAVTLSAGQSLTIEGGTLINVSGEDGASGGNVDAEAGGDLLIIDSQILALGDGAGSHGGDIQASAGGNLDVLGGTLINASGENGAAGGSLNFSAGIDLTFEGAQLLARGSENADGGTISGVAGGDLLIKPGTLIAADGRGENSSGGNIYLFGGDTATFEAGALLSARGGNSGNGGFIELSGSREVNLNGGVARAGAADGVHGTFYVDPEIINLGADGGIFNIDGTDIILEATQEIILADNYYLVSRYLTDDPENYALDPGSTWATAASIGDSGSISLLAPVISIGEGVQILANATGEYSAGEILVQAQREDDLANDVSVSLGTGTVLDASAVDGLAGTVEIGAINLLAEDTDPEAASGDPVATPIAAKVAKNASIQFGDFVTIRANASGIGEAGDIDVATQLEYSTQTATITFGNAVQFLAHGIGTGAGAGAISVANDGSMTLGNGTVMNASGGSGRSGGLIQVTAVDSLTIGHADLKANGSGLNNIGGSILMAASAGISLEADAKFDVRGSASASGGLIAVTSGSTMSVATSQLLAGSTGAGARAGAINLRASGALTLMVNSGGDASGLGGARGGSIELVSGTTLDIYGEWKVNGSNQAAAGDILAAAEGDITLHDDAVLSAAGVGSVSAGGRVTLYSANGTVETGAGAVIDVSAAGAADGWVTMDGLNPVINNATVDLGAEGLLVVDNADDIIITDESQLGLTGVVIASRSIRVSADLYHSGRIHLIAPLIIIDDGWTLSTAATGGSDAGDIILETGTGAGAAVDALSALETGLGTGNILSSVLADEASRDTTAGGLADPNTTTSGELPEITTREILVGDNVTFDATAVNGQAGDIIIRAEAAGGLLVIARVEIGAGTEFLATANASSRNGDIVVEAKATARGPIWYMEITPDTVDELTLYNIGAYANSQYQQALDTINIFGDGNPYAVVRPEATAEVLIGQNVEMAAADVTLNAEADAIGLFSVLPANAAGEVFRRSFTGQVYDAGADTYTDVNLADDWANPLLGMDWDNALGTTPLTGSSIANATVRIGDGTEIDASGTLKITTRAHNNAEFESMITAGKQVAGMVIATGEANSQIIIGSQNAAADGILLSANDMLIHALSESEVSAGARTVAVSKKNRLTKKKGAKKVNEIAVGLAVNRVDNEAFIGANVTLDALGDLQIQATHTGTARAVAYGEATKTTVVSGAIAATYMHQDVTSRMLGVAMVGGDYTQQALIDMSGGDFVSGFVGASAKVKRKRRPSSLAAGAQYGAMVPLLYGLLREDPAGIEQGGEEPDEDANLDILSDVSTGISTFLKPTFLKSKLQALGSISLAEVQHNATAEVGSLASITSVGDLTVHSEVRDRPVLISRVEVQDLASSGGTGTGSTTTSQPILSADMALGHWQYAMNAQTVIGTVLGEDDVYSSAITGPSLSSEGTLSLTSKVDSSLTGTMDDLVNKLLWELEFDEGDENPFDIVTAGFDAASADLAQLRKIMKLAKAKNSKALFELFLKQGLVGMTWVNSESASGKLSAGASVAIEAMSPSAEVLIGQNVTINERTSGTWTVAELAGRDVVMGATTDFGRAHLIGNVTERKSSTPATGGSGTPSGSNDSFSVGVGAALLFANHKLTAQVSGGEGLLAYAGIMEVKSALDVMTLGGVVATGSNPGKIGISGSLNFLQSEQLSRAALSSLESSLTIAEELTFDAVDDTFAIQFAGGLLKTSDSSVGISVVARDVSRTTESGYLNLDADDDIAETGRGIIESADGASDVSVTVTAENKGNALGLALTGTKPSSTQANLGQGAGQKTNTQGGGAAQGGFGISLTGGSAVMLHDNQVRAAITDATLADLGALTIKATDSTLQQAVSGAWTKKTLASGSGSSASLTGSASWQEGTTAVFSELTRFSATDLQKVDIDALRSGWTLNVAAALGTDSNPSGGTSVAIQGSVVGNFLDYQTKAFVTDGSLGNIEELTVDAQDASTIITVAGAIGIKSGGGGTSSVGVGASVALHEFTQDTRVDLSGLSALAFADDSTVTVNATNTGLIYSLAVAGASQPTGAAGVGIVVAYNDLKQNALVLGDSFTLGSVDDRFSDINIHAWNQSGIYSLAGALGRGMKAGIGLAVTNSFIGGRSAIDFAEADFYASDITLKAEHSGNMLAVAVGVASSTQQVSVAGSQAGNFFGGQSEVLIENVTLDAAEELLVIASDDKASEVVAGALALSSGAGYAAIGAAIGINTITGSSAANFQAIDAESDLAMRANNGFSDDNSGRVLVSIVDSELIAGAEGATVEAKREGALYTVTASGVLAATSKVGVGASGSYNRIGGSIGATLSGTSITSGGDVSILASDFTGIYGISGAVASAKNVAVGAGVAYNEIDSSSMVQVMGGSNLQASDGNILLEAVRRAQILSLTVGGASSQHVAVSGSVSLNRILGKVGADVNGSILGAERISIIASDRDPVFAEQLLRDLGFIDDDSSTDSADQLSVSIGSFSGALGMSGGMGVGASAAYNEHRATISAEVEDSELTATGETTVADGAPIRVAADRSTSIATATLAGATGSVAVGVTGSWNEITGGVKSLVSGASVLQGEGVTIEAMEAGSINALSGGIAYSGSGVGGGAGVAVNTISTQVEAGLDGAEVDAQTGLLTLKAERSSTINALTMGVALSGGTAGIGLSYSHNIIGGSVVVSAENGAVLDGHDLMLNTSDIASMISISGAVGTAGSAAIGASAAYSEISTRTAVEIDEAELTATDDIEIQAKAEGKITTLAASGAGSSTVAVSGSAVITHLNREVEVSVNDSTLDAQDSLRLSVSQMADLAVDLPDDLEDFDMEAAHDALQGSFAGGVQVGGTVAAGGAGTVNIFSNKVSTNVTDSTLIARAEELTVGVDTDPADGVQWTNPRTGTAETGVGLFIHSFNEEKLTTAAFNVAVSSTVGVGLSGSVNVFESEVVALVSGGSLTAGTSGSSTAEPAALVIDGWNSTRVDVLTGSLGIGASGVGVGGGVAVNTFNKATTVEVSDTATLSSTAALRLLGESNDDVFQFGAAAAGGKFFGGAATVAVNHFSSELMVGSVGSTLTAGDTLQIKALMKSETEQYLGSLAGGIVGVGGTVASSSFDNVVQAYVDKGTATSNNGQLSVEAELENKLSTLLVSGSAGIGALTGTVNVGTVGGSSSVWTGEGAKLNSVSGNMLLSSQNITSLQNTIGNVAAGGVGIGAGVDVIRLESVSSVVIGKDSELTALGTLSIKARSERDISSQVASGAGGGIALGASVSVITAGDAGVNLDGADWGLSGDDEEEANLDGLNSVLAGLGDFNLVSDLEFDSTNSAVTRAGASLDAATSASSRSDFNVAAAAGADGSFIEIGDGAQLTAGSTLTLSSDALVDVNQQAGNISAGVGAIGAGIDVTDWQDISQVSVGDDAVIKSNGGATYVNANAGALATGTPAFDIQGISGSGGGIALGVLVSDLNLKRNVKVDIGDSDLTAGSNLFLSATETGLSLMDSYAVSAGAIAGGAVVVDYLHDSDVYVLVGAGAEGRATNGLQVLASSSATADLDAEAISAGVVSVAVNAVTGKVTTDVKVEIGDEAKLGAGGVLRVASEASNSVDASLKGVSASAGISVGVGVVDLDVSPTVQTLLSDKVHLAATRIELASTIGSQNAMLAKAVNEASSGSLLLAVSANETSIKLGGSAKVDLGTNALMSASLADMNLRAWQIAVDAQQFGSAYAESKAFSGAILAGAGNKTYISHNGSQTITGGGEASLFAINEITLRAGSDVSLETFSKAGTGGVLAGVATISEIETELTSSIDLGSQALLEVSSGRVLMEAHNEVKTKSVADSLLVAVAGGGGGNSIRNLTANALINTGLNSIIRGQSLLFDAYNAFNPLDSGNDAEVILGGGGVITGLAGNNTTTYNALAKVRFEDGSQITAWDFDGPGLVALAHNDITTRVRTSLTNGAAIAIGDNSTSVTGANITGQIDVGQGAKLHSNAAMRLAGYTKTYVKADGSMNLWGLAGVPDQDVHATMNYFHTVNVEANAALLSVGLMSLAANHTGEQYDPFGSQLWIYTEGRVWNRTAFPIGAATSVSSTLNLDNRINITAGAKVEGVQDVRLTAATGDKAVSAFGRGLTGYEEAADAALGWIGGLFGANPSSVEESTGDTFENATRLVKVDGLVRAGIWNELELTASLDPDIFESYDPATSSLDDYVTLSFSDGISGYVTESRTLADVYSERIAELHAQAALYTESSDIRDAILAQADYLESQLANNPLMKFNIGVPFIVVDPAVSSGGDIIVTAANLYGAASGEMEANGGGDITITNNTPFFLEVSDLKISENAGGNIIYNGSTLTPDSNGLISLDEIKGINADPGVYDAAMHRVYAQGGGDKSAIKIYNTWEPLPIDESDIPDMPGATSEENETYKNTMLTIFGVQEPELHTTGRLENLRGDVILQSNGSIINTGTIRAQSISIQTEGDYIQDYKPGFQHTGGTPEAQLAALFASLRAGTASTSTVTDADIQEALAELMSNAADAEAGLITAIEGYNATLSVTGATLTARYGASVLNNPYLLALYSFFYGDSEAQDYLNTSNYLTAAQQQLALNREQSGAIIAGNNVIISAEFLNINGIIQSGISDYSLVITDDMVTNIDQWRAAYQASPNLNTQFVQLNPLAINDEIAVFYNAKLDRLEVENTAIQGGYMSITGNILSTGQGELRVLDGYGRISVDNQTSLDLRLREIDAGTEIEGVLRIVDTAKRVYEKSDGSRIVVSQADIETGGLLHGVYSSLTELNNNTKALVTEYRRNGGNLTPTQYLLLQGETEYDASAQKLELGSTGDRTGVYNPLEGRVYTYAEGNRQLTEIKTIYYRNASTFFGLSLGDLGDWLAPDTATSKKVETFNLGSVEMDQATAPLFIDLASGDGLAYRKNQFEYDPGYPAPDPVFSRRASKYGSAFFGAVTWVSEYEYSRTETERSGTETHYFYDLRADKPISINFIGHDTSLVTVNSGGDIIVDGLVRSAHQLNLTSSGDIIRGDAGIVIGADINLNATGSIGLEENALLIEVAGQGTRSLDAVAGGNIIVRTTTGDIPLARAHAGANGLVRIESAGGITGLSELAASTAVVKGEQIMLNGGNGGITGAGAYNTLTLDIAQTASARINAEALNDINLSIWGELAPVELVHSRDGDVLLNADGKLVDANHSERVDPLKAEQLQALWNQQRLTGAGADARLADALNAAKDGLTSDYHWYWMQRGLNKTDTGYDVMPYDPDFEITLTADERTRLKASNTWTDTQVDDWLVAQNARYQQIENRFGINATTDYDDSFAATLTDTETNGISNKYAWTEAELKNTISRASLVAAGSTEVLVEDPNVIGNNVTLYAAKGIGTEAPDIVVQGPTEDGQPYADFTEEIRLALSQAERDDLDLDEAANKLTITLREDFDVQTSATGALVARASDEDIYLGSEQAIQLQLVEALTGDIRIKTAKGVQEHSSANRTTGAIVGGDLIIEGGTGSIGSSSLTLTTDLRSGSSLIARSDQSIYLEELAGDMNIDFVFAGVRAELTSAGGILDANRNNAALALVQNIQAQEIQLIAVNDIGSAPAGVDYSGLLDLMQGGTGYVTASSTQGNVYLRSAQGGVILGAPSAGSADNDLGANAIQAVNGEVLVISPGRIDVRQAINALNQIELLAATGMQVNNGVDVKSTTSDIILKTASGDLDYAGHAYAGTNGTTLAGNLTLEATLGSVNVFADSILRATGTADMLAGQVIDLQGQLLAGRGIAGNASTGITIGEDGRAYSTLGLITFNTSDNDMVIDGQVEGDDSTMGIELEAEQGSILLHAGVDNFINSEGYVELTAGQLIDLLSSVRGRTGVTGTAQTGFNIGNNGSVLSEEGSIVLSTAGGNMTLDGWIRSEDTDGIIDLDADLGSILLAAGVNAYIDGAGEVFMDAGALLPPPQASGGLLQLLSSVRGRLGVTGSGHEIFIGLNGSVISEIGAVSLTSISRNLESLGVIRTGDLTVSGLQGGNVLLVSAADALFGSASTVDTEQGNISIRTPAGGISQTDGARLRSVTGELLMTSRDDIKLANTETANATGDAVRFTSLDGAILDAGDSHLEIIANTPGSLATLLAAKGIGRDNALEVQLWELMARNSSSGSIDLVESDDLRIRNIDQQALNEFLRVLVKGDVTLLPGFGGVTSNGGFIDLRAVNGGRGDFYDVVTSNGGNIDIRVDDDLFFSASAHVLSDGGNIRLYAGEGIAAGSGGRDDGTFTQEDGARAYSSTGWLDVQAKGDVLVSHLRSDRITDHPFAEPYLDFSLRVVSDRGGIFDNGDLLLDLEADPVDGYALTVLRSWLSIGEDITNGRKLFLDVDLSVLDAETFGPEAGIFLDELDDLIVKRAVTWDGHVKLGAGGNLDIYLVDVNDHLAPNDWTAQFVSRGGNLGLGTVRGDSAIYASTTKNIFSLIQRPTVLTADIISLVSLDGYIGGNAQGGGYFSGAFNGLTHLYAPKGVHVQSSGSLNIHTAITQGNMGLRVMNGDLTALGIGAGQNVLIEVKRGNADIERLGVGTGEIPTGNWHQFFLGNKPGSPLALPVPLNWTALLEGQNDPGNLRIGQLAYRGLGVARADGSVVLENILQGSRLFIEGYDNSMADWVETHFRHGQRPEFVRLYANNFLITTPSEALIIEDGRVGNRGDIFLRDQWVAVNTWIPEPKYRGEDLLLFAPKDGYYWLEIDGLTVNTDLILPFYLDLDWIYNGYERQRGLYHWWLTDLQNYSSRLWWPVMKQLEKQREKEENKRLDMEAKPLNDWKGRDQSQPFPIKLGSVP